MRKKIMPYDWREKHPRCEFCKYCKLAIPGGAHGLAYPDFFKCLVKEKTINCLKMPRPWCRCYAVEQIKIFEEELVSNEKS